jgi:Phycobilisome protein
MLTQLNKLTREVDGRYATDSELTFMVELVNSYKDRLSAYRKLQAAEGVIMQQVKSRLRAIDPSILMSGKVDISKKCERDMTFVFRYSTLALLMNDPEMLQERVLFWLQTVTRSFKDHRRHCDVTYKVMQEVVKQYLTPTEANLFCPILEIDRSFLS